MDGSLQKKKKRGKKKIKEPKSCRENQNCIEKMKNRYELVENEIESAGKEQREKYGKEEEE